MKRVRTQMRDLRLGMGLVYIRLPGRQAVDHDDEIGITPPPNPRTPNVSIPYGSLVPAGLDNILAAGRNIACDAATHTFLRLIPQCWLMGQAAGVAATTAINSGVNVRNVDTDAVRSELFKQGVILHKQPGSPAGIEQL